VANGESPPRAFTASGCHFLSTELSNTAANLGGAVYNYGGCTFRGDWTFSGNTATSGAPDVVLFCDYGGRQRHRARSYSAVPDPGSYSCADCARKRCARAA
jgi:hypothetical protein